MNSGFPIKAIFQRPMAYFYDIGIGAFGWPTKGGFFQKVRFVFQISKSQEKIFQKTILSLKFNFPANNTLLLKFGHSEKATKIWNNLPLDLTFTK